MNKVVHFEIPFKDAARAKKFYTETFGWNINAIPMPEGQEYLMAQTAKTDDKGMIQDGPGSINGALTPSGPTSQTTVLVIDVEDIDAKLKEVESAGGKVIQPKVPVMDMGLYAKVQDPEGNIVGIWQNIKK